MVGRMTPGDNHSEYTPFANDASEHSAPKQRRPEHGIDRASPDTSKSDAHPRRLKDKGAIKPVVGYGVAQNIRKVQRQSRHGIIPRSQR